MKSIAKGTEPWELRQWKLDNQATPDILRYGETGFPAEKVRQALLSEQSHLCAYTLKPLRTADDCTATGLDTRASCHIEHLKPQARKVPGEDIAYDNIVACFPASQSAQACEFGAKYKDDFDPETGRYVVRDKMTQAKHRIEALALRGRFVNPTGPNAEIHFRFRSTGIVEWTSPSGELTVSVLNLNHPELINDRESVIKGALRPRGKPISANQARRLANSILQPDARNCLSRYCLAVATEALAFAEREDRRAARMRKKVNR